MSLVVDGQHLRALRQARGWDQRRLAHQAGVSPPVVSRLERGLQGDVNASVLVALARSLDTSVDALLVEYREPTPTEPIQELALVVSQLPSLSKDHQRLVAAILRACLSALANRPIT